MKIREKNLKMKYDLSMLKHAHGVSKPYVFSYFVELRQKEAAKETEKEAKENKENKEK